jgi:hypothetical protein
MTQKPKNDCAPEKNDNHKGGNDKDVHYQGGNDKDHGAPPSRPDDSDCSDQTASLIAIDAKAHHIDIDVDVGACLPDLCLDTCVPLDCDYA